jgi:polysaccharide biosynthesis protein PslG
MGQAGRSLTILVAALAISLLAASTAGAAIRSEFFGVEQGPGSTLDGRDMKAMRSAGVHTVRYLFQWETVQPKNGSTFRWSPQDNFIGALASRGIRVVPTVWGNPKWVTGYTARAPIDRPKDRVAWQSFLKAVAKRYGPGGTYWSGRYHEDFGQKATPLPIQSWQIWSEPNLKKYWVPYPDPKKYGLLLQLSHNAIKSVDPHAQIVLGGLVGYPSSGIRAWDFLRQLYTKVPSAKRNLDATALHPYGGTIDRVRHQIVLMRKAMKKARDAATPLWISEIAWGSAPKDSVGINQGPQGQARMLRKAYQMILANRASWKVQRLFWYHWRDPINNRASCTFCGSAGLFRNDRSPKPAFSAFKSFTAVSTAPKASFTSGPAAGSVIHDPTPTFAFKSSRIGSTFQCRVDGGALRACGSPFTTAALSNGDHRFSVRAVDAAGNVSRLATRAFTVAA